MQMQHPSTDFLTNHHHQPQQQQQQQSLGQTHVPHQHHHSQQHNIVLPPHHQHHIDRHLVDTGRSQSLNQHLFPVPVLLDGESNSLDQDTNGSILHNLTQSQWQSYRSSLLHNPSNQEESQQQHRRQLTPSNHPSYTTDQGFMNSSSGQNFYSFQPHSILNHSVYDLSSNFLQSNQRTPNGLAAKMIESFPTLSSQSSVTDHSDSRLKLNLDVEAEKRGLFSKQYEFSTNDVEDSNLSRQVTSPNTIYFAKTAAMLSLASGLENNNNNNQNVSRPFGMHFSNPTCATAADSGIALTNPADSISNEDEDDGHNREGQRASSDEDRTNIGDPKYNELSVHIDIGGTGTSGGGASSTANDHDIDNDDGVVSDIFSKTKSTDASATKINSYRHFLDTNLTFNDEECEPLELELSLELADRIVGRRSNLTCSRSPLSFAQTNGVNEDTVYECDASLNNSTNNQ